jgi:hypothetical protein
VNAPDRRPALRLADAMFVWMVIGLLVGGIGAVLVLLGLLRWSRATRHDAVSPPGTPAP